MNSRLVRVATHCVALIVSAGVYACQSNTTPTVATGTETNWLLSCSHDTECGALACECGLCTRRCDDDAACGLTGAVCSKATGAAVAQLCGSENARFNLCLLECDGACAAGQSCVDGACVPQTDASSQSDDTAYDAASSRAEAGVSSASSSVHTTNDNTRTTVIDSSVSSLGDAALVTPEEHDAQTSSEAGSVPDATLGCPLDTRPLTSGCCYLDSDCESGHACYQAACSGDVLAPGRCVARPSAPNCYSNDDCNVDEVCQDAALAPCGTSGPDAMGTCVPDCGFDSCHPERCDELDEACCDPLPGDGPNYCNAGLLCTAGTCQLSTETQTPEEATRQACEETAGTWAPQSCGHYVCGLPPNCAAVFPGCNCGAGRSFSTLGCFDDPQCVSP